ncbi:hypothetical protein CPB83DRAFT_843483 [Crepidotus variabilis]|uniref:Uncharacterized protein n=1 Tax=Crepidotus variabilis TaxID=179855 RepID=A0A9P6EUU4_9AGAR|nr:hypothetical protein CPB83DRAFT_843483 [Crepidotus variabilis]
MSSIHFPQGHPGQDHEGHESQFYQPNYDTSGFHMNPMSQHPPRTPKSSIVASSSSHHYTSSSIYEEVPEPVEEEKADPEAEDIEIDEEETRVQEADKRIRDEEVMRDMIVTSNGRDKIFKLIQYAIKLGLWFHASTTSTRLLRRQTRPLWEQSIVARLTSVAAGLSLTRKLMLLFNWLHPLTQIMAQQSVPFSSEVSAEKAKKVEKPFLHTLLYAPPPVLLELVNAIADDLATWSKLGLFGQKFGERAGRLSDWCWFLTTMVGLVENGVERSMNGSLQTEVEGRLYTASMKGVTEKSKGKSTRIDEKELARLRKQDYWLQLTRAKLVMDLIFVSYDIFALKRAKDFVKAVAGFSAAILSSAKLYDRHRNILLKALLASAS